MATNEKQVPAETHARHALVTLLLLRALRFKKYTMSYFQFGLVFLPFVIFVERRAILRTPGFLLQTEHLQKRNDWLMNIWISSFFSNASIAS